MSDNHGEYTGIKQALFLFASDNGIDWVLAEHPLVSDRKIEWEDGTREELEDLESSQGLMKTMSQKCCFEQQPG